MDADGGLLQIKIRSLSAFFGCYRRLPGFVVENKKPLRPEALGV